MLIIEILLFILSIILVLILTTKIKVTSNKKDLTTNNNSLILSILIYLVVAYFLSDFYSFNPLEVDPIDGIKINPYVSLVSLVLQFFNTILLTDTWYKAIEERLNKKLSIYILTIIYNLVVIIGFYLLYTGYTGTEVLIYSNIPYFKDFSLLTLYIPFIIYDINLLNIISKKRDKNDTN